MLLSPCAGPLGDLAGVGRDDELFVVIAGVLVGLCSRQLLFVAQRSRVGDLLAGLDSFCPRSRGWLVSVGEATKRSGEPWRQLELVARSRELDGAGTG